jgi:hypothetical protein
MSEKDTADRVWEILSQDPDIAALFATRTPSYRYFPGPRGVRYCWNTEPADERDGHWFAWEYRPVGKGSRTGKGVTRWEMRHRVRCGSRKAAKARACRWVQAVERKP